ncbi:hypothetical protein D9M71_69710 [compost metagenome]
MGLYFADSRLDLGAQAPYGVFGAVAGVPVDPVGAMAQGAGGAVQGSVHGAQMGVGMLVFPGFAAGFAQVIGQCPGRTVPARGDARTAMPEAGSGEIVAWLAHPVADGVVQLHADTGGRPHPHRLPATHLDLDLRLFQGDGHQLRLPLGIPGSEQGMVDLQRTGAPVLTPVQQDLRAARGADLNPRRRRLGGPYSPDAGPIKINGGKFGENGLGVGMAFIQLGQCQVGPRDLGQGAPACQGFATAGQGQFGQARIEACLHDFLQACVPLQGVRPRGEIA